MSSAAHANYERVIGLEVHVQLRTASKLFSPAPVTYGEEPNHSVHEICLALPGVLPVLNARAVEFAIRTALATHCTVHEKSVFARKNYFYPDLPKGYQISQFEEPIATGGWVDVSSEVEGDEVATRRIALTRIHMEEDAGKSIHDDAVAGRDATHVDLNRAGIPLLEIVSEPDIRSPAEAANYLRTLRSILRSIDVSDADLEKGHFRCDANISLRPHGESELGTRTELKNLNSFRFVEEALEAEVERQAEILDEGGRVQQATMAYDPASRRTRVLRVKENADDYRYFPDPDLIPLVLSAEQIEKIRVELPELAEARCERFQREYGVSEDEAVLLTAGRPIADFFEAATRAYENPKPVTNFCLQDLLRWAKERDADVGVMKLSPEGLAALLRLVDEGVITANTLHEIAPELLDRGGDPAAFVRERGLEAVSDTGVIDRAVAEVITEHAEHVERFRSGQDKVLNFLIGQVMRRTRGKANPAAVREILSRKLEE